MPPFTQNGGSYVAVEAKPYGIRKQQLVIPMEIVNYTPGIREPYVLWIDEYNEQEENCTAIEVQYPE